MIKNDKMRKSVWMLATAVVAFMSSCLHAKLTVLEELDAAEAAHGDWKVAAQHYINAFEKFHGGIKTILVSRGGKCIMNTTTITISPWRRNEFPQEHMESLPTYFLDQSTLLSLEPDCMGGIGKAGIKYFKKNIAPELKQHICSTLGVTSRRRKLPQAAAIWDNRLVKPVARLLIEHLTTGGTESDEEKWPLILSLYRAFYYSEFRLFFNDANYACMGIYSDNYRDANPEPFGDVYLHFYNELASAILHCTTLSEHANRLCTLLKSNEGNKVGNNGYEGSLFYGVDIVHLMEVLEAQTNDRTPIPEIQSAIGIASRRAQEERQQRHEDNVRATAEALREAALWL